MSAALLGELQAERSLPEYGLVLVVGVNRHCAALLQPALACSERIGITFAFDDQVGAVLANARDLGWRRNARNVNFRRHLPLHRRVGDRRAVIAARGCGHSDGRHFARQ